MLDALSTERVNCDEFYARSRQLVTGTCVGIGQSHIGIHDNIYDFVIIDEAARSISSELAIAMQSAKRVLLVGDHLQLPPLYSKSLTQDEKDLPSIYTVNSVDKIRQMPLRLTVKFRSDADGRNVEREDFEVLKSSDYVQERISFELGRLARPGDLMDIVKAMMELSDSETLKLFDSKTNAVNLSFLEELKTLESNSHGKRTTFLGPIYLQENWQLLQRHLAPILVSRIENATEVKSNPFSWIAPSDPFWSKSNRLAVALSDFLHKAETKEKKLYAPRLYVPILDADDQRSRRQWKQEIDPYSSNARGLVEGFLGGNVEVLLFEGELVVIIYHLSAPESYPVTLPIGFISTDKKFVGVIEKVVNGYINGRSGLDKPNDCGALA